MDTCTGGASSCRSGANRPDRDAVGAGSHATDLARRRGLEFSEGPCRYAQDIWDPIKYIPLGREGWFLTVGGEAREVVEQVGNDNWGKQPYTNTFFLQRYMLHTDWHLGKYFRAFVQLKSGLESFRQGGPGRSTRRNSISRRHSSKLGQHEGEHWVVCRPAGRS